MTEHMNWHGKRVLITGHTGFKGSWLCLWLSSLGAEIHGLALSPPTEPNLFTVANIQSLLATDKRIDIRNAEEVKTAICSIAPDIIFHLAAQPLVQYSYDAPLETFAVNAMGTAHVLEAIRACDSVRAALVITTDKCYENHEKPVPYCETDRLGGVDPYSSSKACAELVTSAYRASYFSAANGVKLATARAGNVIGGGDWAANRLIPDCIRAHTSLDSITLRYPSAVRPWQYVLESISGYILLAEFLLSENGSQYSEAWNFGPEIEDMQTVGNVANQICNILNVSINLSEHLLHRHEASVLRLDSTKAKKRLHWYPKWSLQRAIEETVLWYQHYLSGEEMLAFSCLQVKRFIDTKQRVLKASTAVI